MDYNQAMQNATPLIDIAHHCQALSGALHAVTEAEAPGKYEGPREWLNLAAGIVAVRYEQGRFDRTSWMCEPVMEYEDAHSALLGPYLTELSRFLYVWSAFEAFMLAACPGLGHRDKVKDYTNYLHASGVDTTRAYPPGFRRCVDLLLCRLDAIDAIGDAEKWKADLRAVKGAQISGRGVRAVQLIRNRLAHGAINVPVHEDWSTSIYLGREEVELASRLVLMTIQMDAAVRDCAPGAVADVCGIDGLEAFKSEECNYEVEASELMLRVHLGPRRSRGQPSHLP